MPDFRRKLLIAGLLGLYGGIALLGYGLHDLAPGHHHHAPSATGHAHSHGLCTGHSHSAIPADCPPGPWLVDAHECEICVFLEQMLSDSPVFAADIDWQQFIVAVSIEPTQLVSFVPLGVHAPRGPPLLIG